MRTWTAALLIAACCCSYNNNRSILPAATAAEAQVGNTNVSLHDRDDRRKLGTALSTRKKRGFTQTAANNQWWGSSSAWSPSVTVDTRGAKSSKSNRYGFYGKSAKGQIIVPPRPQPPPQPQVIIVYIPSPTKKPIPITNAPTRQPVSPRPTEAPVTQRPTISPKPTPLPTLPPTGAPSKPPTNQPTRSPTTTPSKSPSVSPTFHPTNSPSVTPTANPSTSPTTAPTSSPSTHPSQSPTGSPSIPPTASPTNSPSYVPTNNPTDIPSIQPSINPTPAPEALPGLTGMPTKSVGIKSGEPTYLPTGSVPTLKPTKKSKRTGRPTSVTGVTGAPTATPVASSASNVPSSPNMPSSSNMPTFEASATTIPSSTIAPATIFNTETPSVMSSVSVTPEMENNTSYVPTPISTPSFTFQSEPPSKLATPMPFPTTGNIVDSRQGLRMQLFGIDILTPELIEAYQTQTQAYIEDYYNKYDGTDIVRNSVSKVKAQLVVTNWTEPIDPSIQDYKTNAQEKSKVIVLDVSEPCVGESPLNVTFSLVLEYRLDNPQLQHTDIILTAPFLTVEDRTVYIRDYLQRKGNFKSLYCTSRVILEDGSIPASYAPITAPPSTGPSDVGVSEVRKMTMALYGIDIMTPRRIEVYERQTAEYIEDYYNDYEGTDFVRGSVYNVRTVVKVTDWEEPEERIVNLRKRIFPAKMKDGHDENVTAVDKGKVIVLDVTEPCTGEAPLIVTFTLELRYRVEDEILKGSDLIISLPLASVDDRTVYIEEYLQKEGDFRSLYCTSRVEFPPLAPTISPVPTPVVMPMVGVGSDGPTVENLTDIPTYMNETDIPTMMNASESPTMSPAPVGSILPTLNETYSPTMSPAPSFNGTLPPTVSNITGGNATLSPAPSSSNFTGNETSFVPTISPNGTSFVPTISPNGTSFVPTLSPNATSFVPTLSPNATSFVPTLSTNGTEFSPTLSPNGTDFGPTLSPNATDFVPTLSPNATDLVPTLSPNITDGASPAPTPPLPTGSPTETLPPWEMQMFGMTDLLEPDDEELYNARTKQWIEDFYNNADTNADGLEGNITNMVAEVEVVGQIPPESTRSFLDSRAFAIFESGKRDRSNSDTVPVSYLPNKKRSEVIEDGRFLQDPCSGSFLLLRMKITITYLSLTNVTAEEVLLYAFSTPELRDAYRTRYLQSGVGAVTFASLACTSELLETNPKSKAPTPAPVLSSFMPSIVGGNETSPPVVDENITLIPTGSNASLAPSMSNTSIAPTPVGSTGNETSQIPTTAAPAPANGTEAPTFISGTPDNSTSAPTQISNLTTPAPSPSLGGNITEPPANRGDTDDIFGDSTTTPVPTPPGVSASPTETLPPWEMRMFGMDELLEPGQALYDERTKQYIEDFYNLADTSTEGIQSQITKMVAEVEIVGQIPPQSPRSYIDQRAFTVFQRGKMGHKSGQYSSEGSFSSIPSVRRTEALRSRYLQDDPCSGPYLLLRLKITVDYLTLDDTLTAEEVLQAAFSTVEYRDDYMNNYLLSGSKGEDVFGSLTCTSELYDTANPSTNSTSAPATTPSPTLISNITTDDNATAPPSVVTETSLIPTLVGSESPTLITNIGTETPTVIPPVDDIFGDTSNDDATTAPPDDSAVDDIFGDLTKSVRSGPIYDRKCGEVDPYTLSNMEEISIEFLYGVESKSRHNFYISDLEDLILDFLTTSVLRCTKSGLQASVQPRMSRVIDFGVVRIRYPETGPITSITKTCDVTLSEARGCLILNTKILVTASKDRVAEAHRAMLTVLADAFSKGIFSEFVPDLILASYLGPDANTFYTPAAEASSESTEDSTDNDSSEGSIVVAIVFSIVVVLVAAVWVFAASPLTRTEIIKNMRLALRRQKRYVTAPSEERVEQTNLAIYKDADSEEDHVQHAKHSQLLLD